MRMLGPALRSLIACVLLVTPVLASATPGLASAISPLASTAPRGVDMLPKENAREQHIYLEGLVGTRGDPPAAFVERTDAQRRVELRLPSLNGTFFT